MTEDEKKRLEELEEIEKLYYALFNRTNDAVFLINLDGSHRKVNKKVSEMLGYEPEEIEGHPAREFIAHSEYDNSQNMMEKLFSGESIPIYERIFKRKDGSTFCGENDVTLVRDSEGNPSYFFSIVRDVTVRKEVQKKLEEMAWYDHLTGLLNRRSIMEKIEQEIIRYERSRIPFTLLLMDIDYFKKINDRFGHDYGDYVLCEVSKTLENNLRKQDLCSRWGGEEFLIFLPETVEDGGVISAEKIRKEIASLYCRHRKKEINITVTIGVAEYKGRTLDECIKKADQALYKGKKSGRNCVIKA